jgi:hypothetical protein
MSRRGHAALGGVEIVARRSHELYVCEPRAGRQAPAELRVFAATRNQMAR